MNVQVNDLGPKYSIYGNKGNVWENTAHIYESGKGNLCGTPALSSNWARIEGLTECGCVECNRIYSETIK
jgi:formylglycine-generating enzyme required for sulfatase activity